MNNKKIILSILAVAAIFGLAIHFSSKEATVAQEKAPQPIQVSVQSAADSKNLTQENQYPATVVGDQEIRVTAKSAGTVSNIKYNIGDKISVGALLARIDDTGTLEIGDQGFRNLQIQQSQLSVEQAKKAYRLAKDVYDNVRKSASSTSDQKDTAKAQVAIAKLQYESATLGLNGSVDNHLITSPISGIITDKAVSNGDSVSTGQLIATVSQSSKIKVQFFVDQKQRDSLKTGQEISILDSSGNDVSMIIKNIAIQADQATKRFLVEAYPKNTSSLLSGTIVTVSIKSQQNPQQSDNILLPLSAISVGQNESYIFVAQDNIAKKVIANVVNVQGETAEISANISPETLIITDGSKLVHDGETITIKQ